MIAVLVTFVFLFVRVFNFLLIVRVLMSWVYPDPYQNRFSGLIADVTEPLLAPLRKVLPKSAIDLSPLAAFLLLQILASLILYLVSGTISL